MDIFKEIKLLFMFVNWNVPKYSFVGGEGSNNK